MLFPVANLEDDGEYRVLDLHLLVDGHGEEDRGGEDGREGEGHAQLGGEGLHGGEAGGGDVGGALIMLLLHFKGENDVPCWQCKLHAINRVLETLMSGGGECTAFGGYYNFL